MGGVEVANMSVLRTDWGHCGDTSAGGEKGTLFHRFQDVHSKDLTHSIVLEERQVPCSHPLEPYHSCQRPVHGEV